MLDLAAGADGRFSSIHGSTLHCKTPLGADGRISSLHGTALHIKTPLIARAKLLLVVIASHARKERCRLCLVTVFANEMNVFV
jgi:hypothetical protein